MDRDPTMSESNRELLGGATASKPVKAPLTLYVFILGLSGCGITGPLIQHTSGDLVHLGSTTMTSLSCGHDLSTYADQAQLICQKNGYKAAKIRYSQNSKNESCSKKIVEATFKCEESSSF